MVQRGPAASNRGAKRVRSSLKPFTLWLRSVTTPSPRPAHRPHYCLQGSLTCSGWVSRGLSNKQIAENLQIAPERSNVISTPCLGNWELWVESTLSTRPPTSSTSTNVSSMTPRYRRGSGGRIRPTRSCTRECLTGCNTTTCETRIPPGQAHSFIPPSSAWSRNPALTRVHNQSNSEQDGPGNSPTASNTCS